MITNIGSEIKKPVITLKFWRWNYVDCKAMRKTWC